MTDDDADRFHTWLIKRGRSENTARDYVSQVRLAFQHRHPTQRLIDEALAPLSRRMAAAALRQYASFAEDAELAEALRDMRLPRAERISEKTPLSERQWRELRRSIAEGPATPHAKNALLLVCRRGFRIGAVCGLPLEQCVQAVRSGTLVFKSKQRYLRYGTTAIEDLVRYFADLAGERGKTIGHLVSPRAKVDTLRSARKRLYRLLHAEALRVGINPDDISPHRLRHTVATLYYERTKDIVALQEYMQWADIKIARGYVNHLRQAELDELGRRIIGGD